jgi:hypothetical protein
MARFLSKWLVISMILESEVGPVFNVCAETDAYISAIRRDNFEVRIVDRRTYIRVLGLKKCILKRLTLEKELGDQVVWPECLALMMPSLNGRFEIRGETAEWNFRGEQ